MPNFSQIMLSNGFSIAIVVTVIVLLPTLSYLNWSTKVNKFIESARDIDPGALPSDIQRISLFSGELRQLIYRAAENDNPEIRALAHAFIDRNYRGNTIIYRRSAS